MGQKETQFKRVCAEIDEILWAVWDPIGVNEFDESRDEYELYVLRVYRLLIDGASKSEIMNHLESIERELLGLTGSSATFAETAERLLRIDVST